MGVLGLAVRALAVERLPQAVQALRERQRLRPRAPDRHGLAVEGLGLVVAARTLAQQTQVMEAGGDLGVIGRERSPPLRQGFLEQRPGLVEARELEVDRAHGVEQHAAQLGPGVEPADLLGPAVQDLAHRYLAARRLPGIGAPEQVGQEARQLPRLVGLQVGAVALVGDTLRLARLVEGESQQHRGDTRGRRGRHQVAAQELGGAVAQGVRPGEDRAALGPPPQVGGELLHRGVAPGGLDGERLEHDRVEVAVHLGRRRLPRQGALSISGGVRARKRRGRRPVSSW